MKHTIFPVVILSIACWGMLFAQEANYSERETVPETAGAVVDTDNSGVALLDQATEAKLRATTILDLSRVIDLCQRAKREGLSGENLKYCNQLLASSQLQRGLFLAQQLLGPPNVHPSDWQALRQRALSDIEESVTVIKDQPMAYLRIAQLNLMPEGDADRAKEALKLAIQHAGDEPAIQMLAVRLLTEIEPATEIRETVLSDAAKNGNPQIVLLHALTLLELDRKDEAINILKQLLEAQSGDVAIHEHILSILAEAGEHELAISVLDVMHEKADDERKNRIDMVKADMLNASERHEDALILLNTLFEKVQGDAETMVMLLIRRSGTHLALDNLDEALKDIETAEQSRPNSPSVLDQKYRVLIEQENYDDALATVKKLQAIAERPQNFHFFREIYTLIELERYDDAVAVVQTLRKKHPDDEQQWIALLVEIYSKQKAYDKALTLVEEQLQESPEELRWILGKASIYAEQEKWDEAINWLESQLQKNPDSRVIELTLLTVLYDKKSFRTAKERIHPLLEKEPGNLTLLRLDSQLSISLGLHTEAVAALTKVVEAAPNDYTSVNNLAWILATSPMDSVRDGRRAVELAERAGELTRHKRAFVLSTLAAAYAEVGNFEKAREWAVISVDVAKKERGKTEKERNELLEHLQKEWDAFSQDMPFREMLGKDME